MTESDGKVNVHECRDYHEAARLVWGVLGGEHRIAAILDNVRKNERRRPLVFIKPNLVVSRVNNEELHGDRLFCSITHPSIIDAAYQFFTQNGCDVVVGESPLTSANIPDICRRAGITSPITDLRPWKDVPKFRKIGPFTVGWWSRVRAPGDPRGYEIFEPEFRDPKWRFHNSSRRHERIGDLKIANSALDADLIVGLPKLKTHAKTGFTCCRKLFVGIIGEKEWLPHYSVGVDRFSRQTGFVDRFKNYVSRFPVPFTDATAGIRWGRNPIQGGAVPGNKTLETTVNRINDVLDRHAPPIFNIVDAVIAGQGHGPLSCTPFSANFIATGWDRAAIDDKMLAMMLQMGMEFPRGWREYFERTSGE